MIVFLEVPGFYAAVEAADDPSLVGRPLVVGGDPAKNGLVTSASAEALAAGVRIGEPVREALVRCPAEAVLRSTRLRRYREMSAAIRASLRGAAERLEPSGLDSFYLEPRGGSVPLVSAAELCVRIRAEFGVTARAGLGPTRFVAQRAARHPLEPGEIRQVSRSELQEFLDPLPVSELWGLGPATVQLLHEHGIGSIGALRDRPLVELEGIVGRGAAGFLALAKGSPDAPLRPSPRLKSLSQERTLAEATLDFRVLEAALRELASGLESLLAREQRSAQTLHLGVAYVDGQRVTRTRTLESPIRDRHALLEVALQLVGRTEAGVRLCRRLRLQATNLCPADSGATARQLRLF